MEYKIFPISENALTIDFGNRISADLNDHVIQFADYLYRCNFKGFIELVPAYSSLTIFFDPVIIRQNSPEHSTAFSVVKTWCENALKNSGAAEKPEPRLIKIPVCYDPEFAPDLEFIAEIRHLSPDEVIKIHSSKIYRVFMIGFLPAFAYMGEVDEKIAAPRKQTPRINIKKGSVGIAGKQTGVYPLDSPGGWQIIGKTPIEMFQPENEQISRLQIGDLIQFYQIGIKDFETQSKIQNLKAKTG